MLHKVFVYGTLRPGTTETVLVPGVIYDLGWFPGLTLSDPSKTDARVTCEIIEVDDSGLVRLDTYEGYSPDHPDDSLYLREKFEDGFIYVYNQDFEGRPVVDSGDWLVHTGKSKSVNSYLGSGGVQ